MKKRISLFLSFLLVFTALVIPDKYAFADNAKENKNESEGLLIVLGIIDSAENNYERSITRSEFAEFVVKFLNTEASGNINARYYLDVPSSLHGAGEINLLYEMGLMRGVGNSSFAPNDTISSKDAAKVLLTAAGYKENGEFKIDYDYYAQKYKLISKNAKAISYGQVLDMLCEALTVPLMELETDGSYTVNEEKSVLSEKFDVVLIEGVVTSVENISLNNATAGDNASIIAGEVVENGDVDLYDAFGCEVKAYVKDTDDSYEVIYYSLKEDKDVTVINAYDMEPVTSLKITYKKNNRTATEVLPSNVKVYKNGEQIKSGLVSALNIKNGEIKLLDNNKTAVIKTADYVVVKSYNDTLETIFADYGKKIDLKTDTQKYVIYDENGLKTSASALKEGSFLEVYRSNNITEIHISNNIISGKIKNVDEETVTVDDTVYNYEEECGELLKKYLSTGGTAKLYVNQYGYIVYAEADEAGGNWRIGFVARAKNDEDSGDTILKLYTDEGKFEALHTSERTRVDGGTKTAEQIEKLFLNDPQLIRFKLNSAGKLMEIDTASEKGNTEYSLTDIGGGFKNRPWLKSNAGKLGKDILCGEALIIQVPPLEEADNEEGYALNPSLSDSTSYYAAAYSSDPDSFSAEVIVVSTQKTSGTLEWTAPLCMLDKVVTIWDESKEEIRTKVICYGQADSVATSAGAAGRLEYYVAENYDPTIVKSDKDGIYQSCPLSELEQGDLFLMTRNGSNEIDGVYQAFDYSKEVKMDAKKQRYSSPDDTGGAEGRIIMGFANDKKGAYVKMGYDSPAEFNEYVFFHGQSNFPVIVFDKTAREDKIFIGTIDDVMTYKEIGDNASALVTNSYNGREREVFIYKYGTNK